MQNSLTMRQLQSEHDALRKRHNRLNDMLLDLTEERNAAWHEAHENLIAKGEVETKAEANRQTLQESSEILRRGVSPEKVVQSKEIETYASKIEEGKERLAKAQKVYQNFIPLDTIYENVSLPQQPTTPHSTSSSSGLSSFTSSWPSSRPSSTSSSRFPKALLTLKRSGG